MAIVARKKAKAFLDNQDEVVDWRPLDKLLNETPRSQAAGHRRETELTIAKLPGI